MTTNSAINAASNQREWIACLYQRPPEGIKVETKIDDEKGVRNEQPLYFLRGLWWSGEGRDAMYVYYNPTHWRPTWGRGK